MTDSSPPAWAAQASTLRMIEESGLRFRLGAMGIEVEGRRKDVFALLARCRAAPSTAPGVHRMSTVIKNRRPHRRGLGEMERKVSAVQLLM